MIKMVDVRINSDGENLKAISYIDHSFFYLDRGSLNIKKSQYYILGAWGT